MYGEIKTVCPIYQNLEAVYIDDDGEEIVESIIGIGVDENGECGLLGYDRLSGDVDFAAECSNFKEIRVKV